MKSFWDWAPDASSILAPTDVPLLTICFDRIYSCFSSLKYIPSFTILIAKE